MNLKVDIDEGYDEENNIYKQFIHLFDNSIKSVEGDIHCYYIDIIITCENGDIIHYYYKSNAMPGTPSYTYIEINDIKYELPELEDDFMFVILNAYNKHKLSE